MFASLMLLYIFCFSSTVLTLEESSSSSLLQDGPVNSTTVEANRRDVKNYAAFPKRGDRVRQTEATIRTFAEAGNVHIQPSQNYPEFLNILYWEFNITAAAARLLRQRIGTDATLVETKTAAKLSHNESLTIPPLLNNSVELDSLGLKNFVPQYDAPEDLKVVSWPPGKFLAKLKSYLYNNDFSVAPMTYIIDIGVDKNAKDFELGVKRWYFSPLTWANRKASETDDGPGSHGSCVSSKAVGLKSGVYKSSKLVVVKIDPILAIKDIDWAFDTVLTDMRRYRDANPAVVVFSVNSEPHPDPEEWGPVQLTMGKIFNAGGTIVVSSGNEGADNKDVDTLPAGWADAVFPLIVAGSVNDRGILSSFSQGPSHVTTWAPGENVQCAMRKNAQGQSFQFSTGTSFSAGMVAGLASYGLALREVPSRPDVRTPRAVKAWLRGTARWRRPGGTVPVIWNTLDGF